MKTSLVVSNMQCGHCVATINKELRKVNGVFGVEANIATQTLEIDHTEEVDVGKMKAVIASLGYSPNEPQDLFAHKAAQWDENPIRVEQATTFFRRIVDNVPLNSTDVVVDFGCGTDLVGLQFIPYVKSVVMVDNSPAMMEVLRKKWVAEKLTNEQVQLVEGGMEKVKAKNLKLIVTLMALHHVEDTQKLLTQFYQQVEKGGYLAIGDLEKEDGRFHNEKVPHNGFEPYEVCKMLNAVGFELLLCETFHQLTKDTAEGSRAFPQFLIIAKK